MISREHSHYYHGMRKEPELSGKHKRGMGYNFKNGMFLDAYCPAGECPDVIEDLNKGWSKL